MATRLGLQDRQNKVERKCSSSSSKLRSARLPDGMQAELEHKRFTLQNTVTNEMLCRVHLHDTGFRELVGSGRGVS